MKLAYFWIVLGTILGPLALSFDKKVFFASKRKRIFAGIFVASSLYIIWDIVFTYIGIWKFNPKYIIGASLFRLPFEEYLFFIAVPYACLFVYECLKVYFPSWEKPKIALVFSWLLIVLSVITVATHLNRIYTAVTGLLLLVTLLNQVWVTRSRYMSHLFIAWIICILPMAVVNGLLTGLPILIYNDTQNLGFRIGTIPIEDFFYNLLYMLWMIWVYEKPRQLEIPIVKNNH
jgi:lycopene cyclase domain-containing protein